MSQSTKTSSKLDKRQPRKLSKIPDFPLYAHGWNHIYCIVAEVGNGDFVVKVGMSQDPYRRYTEILPGIPFKSVMMHASVGRRKEARRVETHLHRAFREHHTRGEWFRFTLDDKEFFHATCKFLYARTAGRELDWQKISDEQAYRVLVARQERNVKYNV